jgi:pimeloyl-ACP methyl ester carboxylesterase
MNPVLLLHGALGSSTQLNSLKEILERKDRTVFALNFSGHSGEPFLNDFGIEIFSGNILSFLEQHNLHQVDIFGYSMGGYVALWFATEHSDRVGKIVTLGTKFDWSVASAEKEVRKLDPEKIKEKVPAFARILEYRHAPNNWETLLHKTSAMMTALGNRPLLTESLFKTINHEVTILLGDQDDMADRNYSETVAHMLPMGKFELLENTTHPIEKADLNKLASFL